MTVQRYYTLQTNHKVQNRCCRGHAPIENSLKVKRQREKNTNDQGPSSGYREDKPPKRPINGSFKAFWEKHDVIDLI